MEETVSPKDVTNILHERGNGRERTVPVQGGASSQLAPYSLAYRVHDPVLHTTSRYATLRAISP